MNVFEEFVNAAISLNDEFKRLIDKIEDLEKELGTIKALSAANFDYIELLSKRVEILENGKCELFD